MVPYLRHLFARKRKISPPHGQQALRKAAWWGCISPDAHTSSDFIDLSVFTITPETQVPFSNMPPQACDFVVVGGGIAGTVVASRLRAQFTDASIALVEAGHDCKDSPLLTDIRNSGHLAGSELD